MTLRLLKVFPSPSAAAEEAPSWMLILVVYFNAKAGSAIVSLIVRILEIHFGASANKIKKKYRKRKRKTKWRRTPKNEEQERKQKNMENN